jgi:hypothetical protein
MWRFLILEFSLWSMYYTLSIWLFRLRGLELVMAYDALRLGKYGGFTYGTIHESEHFHCIAWWRFEDRNGKVLHLAIAYA